MAIEQLTPAYVVHTGDFADYACLDCAREFATQRGLVWHGADDYTEEDPATDDGVCVVYSWEGAECDYPVACTCGQYLDNVRLTYEGELHMLGADYPTWLLEAHGVSETTDNN